MSRHRIRNTRHAEHRWDDIDCLDQLRRRDAGRDQFGVANDEGDARRFFVRQPSLLIESVFAVEVAVIAGEHDDRIVECSQLRQRLHETTKALIHGQQHFQSAAHIAVFGSGGRTQRRQRVDATLQGRLVGDWREGVRPSWHHRVGISSSVTRCRNKPLGLRRENSPRAVVLLQHIWMHGLVRQEQHERLRRIGAHKLVDVVGKHIGDIALHFKPSAVNVELGIDGFALTLHGYPARPAGALTVVVPHVPLAEESGLISRSLEWNGKGWQQITGRIARSIVDDPIRVRIRARQDGGAAGAAQRRGGKCIEKSRALAGQLVDIWRFDKRMAGHTDIIPAQIIHQHHYNVWFAHSGRLVAGLTGHCKQQRYERQSLCHQDLARKVRISRGFRTHSLTAL